MPDGWPNRWATTGFSVRSDHPFILAMRFCSFLTALYLGGVTVASAELQLHWPLDSSSGTEASDESGNGLNGNWEGTSGSAGWQPAGGIDGGAVSFTGANRDTFITSSFAAVSGTPFTISTWVKTSSSSNEAAVYLGDGSTGSQYYIVRVQGRVGRANARNGSEIQCSGTTSIDDGEWHHLVGVYASPTDRKIYVDGELEQSSSTNVAEVALTRFGIGGLTRNTPHNPADLFNGEIDDVALWDREFSEVDVAALRGLTLLGAGNAGNLDDLMTAFESEGSAIIRGVVWEHATGLTGEMGATGGSIGGDAFIVLDDSGNGMKIAGSGEVNIASFSVNHESIAPGIAVTLTWDVANADTVTLSGFGSVSPSNGAVAVAPGTTTTYTLTASNDMGTVSEEITVTVADTVVDPRISEFLARNENGIKDEDGERLDWIEIHNDSGYALNLGGYSLTDESLLLSKWSFPSLVLGVDERVIVWASAKNRTSGELHTNFTLDADGDYLALVRPDGAVIVQEFGPLFEPQLADISYGEEGFLSPPTPGGINGEGALEGRLETKVVFGTQGGLFFGGTVNLVLSHDDPLSIIRYTTDGSLPEADSMEYNGPIAIAASTQINARAFRANYLPGPNSQEGYIFAENALSSFDSDLPILVIDTFNTEVPRNDVTFRQAAYAAFNRSDTTGRSSLSDVVAEGGNSGIHVRGESSQLPGFNKLNFAFETRNSEGEDKDVSLFGMPEGSDWALHASEIDRTFIRERLPHYLFNEIGRYSARTRPVEVFLNQDGGPVTESDYRGIYLVIERIRRDNDRVDIARLEPDENVEPDVTGGFIFKKDKGDTGDIRVSTPVAGDFTITYPIEVTTAQREYLQNYLRDFELALQGPSFTDPETGYAAYIDVESWIDFHVIQELTKEVDSYIFSTFFYKDRNGKIACGPMWDFDRSFGNTRGADEHLPEGWRGGTIGSRGEFWDRLFEDPDFMQRYIDRWQELMELNLNDAHLGTVIDGMAAEVNEAKDRNFEPAGPWPLANVTRSHLTFPTYHQHVDYLKDWISTRLAWVDEEFTRKPEFLQSPGVYQNGFDLSLTGGEGTIYYTTDGSDPRASGGGIAGTALSGAIPISASTAVVARSLSGGEWSGPLSGSFIIGEAAGAGNLAISELMYHPSAATDAEIAAGFDDEEDFEFLELINVGENPIEMADVVISEAFDFTFGVLELSPGERVLVVRNLAAFEFRYGAGQTIAGEYGDQKLNNGGERILVTAADGIPILDFTYSDESPWPTVADGGGSSLQLINPPGVPEHGEAIHWKSASPSPGGNGGAVAFAGGDLLEYATTGFGGNGLSYSFGINPLAEGVQYEVEVSHDLENWNSDSSVIRYLGEVNGERSYESTNPGAVKSFMRLRVRVQE